MVYLENIDDYNLKISQGGSVSQIRPKITLEARKDETGRAWIENVYSKEAIIISKPVGEVSYDGTVYGSADDLVDALNESLGSLLNYLKWFTSYKTRVEADTGAVEDDSFSTSVYKIFDKKKLQTDMKLSVIAEGGLKTRTSGVEKYVTKAYDLSDSDIDPVQTTENSQPFLGGRNAPNEIRNFKSVTGVTKTLTHTDIVVSGTYTIIKVLNAEDSGKTVVSFTEVGSGTYNSIVWTGRLYAYMIYGGAITSENQALIESDLLALVAEVEYVLINNDYWATSNLEIIKTPQNITIANVTDAANVDKVVNGGFDTDVTGWTLKDATAGVIAGVVTIEATANNGGIHQLVTFSAAKRWAKVVVSSSFNTSNLILQIGATIFGGEVLQKLNITGTNTYYIDKGVATALYLSLRVNDSGIGERVDVDSISVSEMGWSGLGDLYTDLVSNKGHTAYNAYKEVSAWAYHSNNSDLGFVYGKVYNGYGKELLITDIATQADWGWHIATEAELTALALQGGFKLKVAGTSYWNTDNGTNETGFTALGGATRSDADGSFSTIKDTTAFWCADSDKVLLLNHADNTAVITAVNKGYGAYIRIVSDLQFPIPLA